MPGDSKNTQKLSIRNMLFASTAVLVLHACATPSAPVLTADGLLSTPYTLAGGNAFDVDAFFAALPGPIAVTYADAVFDPASGAMVVTDLNFGIGGADGLGVHADRGLIWGGDAAAMEAVLSGAGDLTTMAPLIDRMTLEGLRSQGMQWDAGAESASFSIDKMVIDGLAARSFALTPKESDAKGFGFLRRAAAVMNSFAYDGAAYSNLVFQLSDSTGNSVGMTVEQGFARGYRAGAVDYQSALGVRAAIESREGGPLVEVAARKEGDAGDEKSTALAKILNKPSKEKIDGLVRRPAALLASAAGGGTTEYAIALTEVRGADISGGLSWLARGELPPITETNLIDFGSQFMTGYVESWNGRTIYSVDRAEVRASDFYWLVPADYEVIYSGLYYDLKTSFDQAQSAIPSGPAMEAAPQFAKIYGALAALGIEQISGDAAMSWNWSGETGAAELAGASDLLGIMSNSLGVRLSGPSLGEWDAMVRGGQTEAAVGAVALSGFDLGLTDKGILDRAFAYAAEQQGAGSGPELRQTIAAMARLSGVQAAEANPRIAGYANAIADFIASGGTIAAVAAPQAPVSLLELEQTGKTAPQTLPDILNISVTHAE